MPGIITPVALDAEEIMNFPGRGPGTQCRVVSGYASFYEKDFLNVHGDDKKWVFYDVHMVVGPKWRDVRDCSPIVGIDGFSFMESDATDPSGTEILECKWDTVGLSEGQTNFERIRLKVKLRMCGGEWYSALRLGYHLIAIGR
jgi:hypothetical protein